MTIDDPRTVPCSYCDAGPDQPCVDFTGIGTRVLPYVHRIRVERVSHRAPAQPAARHE